MLSTVTQFIIIKESSDAVCSSKIEIMSQHCCMLILPNTLHLVGLHLLIVLHH